MQLVLLLSALAGDPGPSIQPLVRAALLGQPDLVTIERTVASAWAAWRNDPRLLLSYSVSVNVVRPDPALKSAWLVLDSEGTPLRFWRTELARKGDKHYRRFTSSPASTPEIRDRDLALSVYDGKRSWTWRPGLRNAYMQKGDLPQQLPLEDFYGDLIGIRSSVPDETWTLRGKLPYPSRLDEALASGAYKVVGPQTLAGDLFCTLIERAGLDRLWLDPNRGYCIVQREWHWDLGGPLKARIVNSQFRQVLDALWLPTRCRVEYYGTPELDPHEVSAVAELSVDRLEVNLSDDIFVPKLSARTLVMDVDRQVSWVTPAAITPESLEQVIAKADEYRLTPPKRAFGRGVLLGIVSGVVLAAVLVGILWWRRKPPARKPLR